MVARLQHPNIVPIYEVGEHEGRPYFSMEYVAGTDLEKLTRGKALPSDAAAGLVQAVAEAVAYAHGQGVVHRDLKPSNILLGTDKRPRVTDFGLARQIGQESSLTLSGAIIGTPGYMPPEQASLKHGRNGTWSDTYSLGAVLYHLLTGRPPFNAGTLADTLDQVLNMEPVPVRRLNPAVPQDLESICLKCLEKEPHRRYASADSLAADLGRFRRGEPTSARPAKAPERLLKWARRRPLVAALSLAAAATFALGLSATLWQWRRAKSSATSYRNSLVGSYLNAGMSRIASGDGIDALPWLIAARALEADNSIAERMNRYRLGTALATCHELVQMIFPGEQVKALAFSPDGKWLGTVQRNKMARIWSVHTGNAVSPVLNGSDVSPAGRPADLSDFIRFSPDGHLLLASTGANAAGLWEVPSGRAVARSLPHNGHVLDAAFSPRGDRVVTASEDGTIRVWSSADGQPLTPYLTNYGNVNSVCFSPDGRKVVAGTAGFQVNVWDIEARKIVFQAGHGGDVWRVAFSPDGESVLACSRDHGARVWNLRTTNEVLRIEHASDVVDGAFSPDGSKVVTASEDHTAQIFEVAGKKRIGEALTHRGSIERVCFSPDGKWVCTASWDRTARVWDAESGAPIGAALIHGSLVNAAAFGPDSRLVGSASDDGTVKIWRLARQQPAAELRGLADWVMAAQFSHDGRLVAAADRNRTVCVWDALDGHLVAGNLRPRTGGMIWSLDFDPGGTKLLTTHDCGDVRLWDVNGGRSLQVWTNRAEPRIALFNPDGTRILIGDAAGVAQFYDAVGFQPIGAPMAHSSLIFSAQFSPTGLKLATASADGCARIWRVSNSQLICPPLRHQDEVYGVAFSPDGRLLASASADQTARVWDAESGREVAVFHHAGPVNGVSFSPNGRLLATTSADQTARVWDIAARRQAYPPLQHENSVQMADFSADGRFLATFDWEGSARIWDATTGRLVSRLYGQEVSCAALDKRSLRLATGNLIHQVQLWNPVNETRPMDFLADYGELVSHQSLDPAVGEITRPSADTMELIWKRFRGRYPQQFSEVDTRPQ